MSVTWADEQIVIATWASFGVSLLSLAAAVVVGVYVARTLEATKESARAAESQAEAAQAALAFEQQRAADERAAAAVALEAERRRHDAERAQAIETARNVARARVDDQMPTVTITVTADWLTLHATTAEFDSPTSLEWSPSSFARQKKIEVWEDVRLHLQKEEDRDDRVWFREGYTMQFENHSSRPARVTFASFVTQDLSVRDARELNPMYLAPGEKVGVHFTRDRFISQVGPFEESARLDAIMMEWHVGDVRGDASDTYLVNYGTAYYSLDGPILSVAARPRNLLASMVTAIPVERSYRMDQERDHEDGVHG